MVISGFENKIAEINSQLKLKLFELERTALSYEETSSNLAQSRVEIEKYHKKMEVLTTEYYTLQTRSEKQIAELTAKLQECSDKIIFYESGNSPATSTKVGLEQLENNNKVVAMLETEKERNLQLTHQLAKSGDLLHHATQPSNYLVDLIMQRDAQLDKCQKLIEYLDTELSSQQTANRELLRKKEALEAQCYQMMEHDSKFLALKRIIEQIQHKVSPPPHATFHISDASGDIGKKALEINSAPLWYQKLRTSL